MDVGVQFSVRNATVLAQCQKCIGRHTTRTSKIGFKNRTERRRKADSSALAQIGLLISNSQGIPTVKRIRKTA